jgi:fructose-1,6-bisphosphatase I
MSAPTNGHKNGEQVAGVGTESINVDIVTLTRFLTEEQTKHKEATGDFTYASESSPGLLIVGENP